jgi:hypothetical protein
MTTEIKGILEIDHTRGVIYFHTTDEQMIERYGTVTPLRLCSLPTPIPTHAAMDVTHMVGVSWASNKEKT